MPKKACCCVSNYIAIPCRYVSAISFDTGAPQWAHWAGGSPEPIGGFGGGQYALRGPFRYIGGQKVFDTTRQIRYLLRGAGGGATGVTFDLIRYSMGGNGAYIEYQKNADSQDVVRSGKGGSGGWFNSILPDRIPPSIQKKGGGAHAVSSEGGGASIIYKAGTYPFVAAGAGGGGDYYYQWIYPEDFPFTGPRNGGNAGLTQAQSGQTGYNSFLIPKEQGAGGGASSTRGGSAGNAPSAFDTHSLPGTIDGGGRGQIDNQGPGAGGGGGGGLYGGGGGANHSGGGGGSSTVTEGLSGYCFEPKNNLPANSCNPWMYYSSGLGGRVLPRNTSVNGNNGEIVQYYILGECKCDESKNELPDKLFICLNKDQYDQIIEDLGEPPAPGGFSSAYDPLFTIDDEDYILLGLCDQKCEDIYVVPSDTDIVDVRWSRNTSGGGGGGGFGPPETPACCSQIVCRPVCPLSGVNCANCGCDEYSDVFVCCDTIGKPDQYTSIYNGWIYSCTKSNNNWIIPGQETENVTNQCLDPATGPQPICTQPSPESCIKTVDIPYTECNVYYPENCNLTITVNGPTVYYQYFGQAPCNGQHSYTINGVIPLINFGGSINVVRPSSTDNCPNPFGPSYTLSTLLSFSTSNITETAILSIDFDCVPTNFLGLPPATGIWTICDAQVNVIRGPLSNIVDSFNSLLGGRVTLTDLSGGKYYVGGNFNDTIIRIVSTIADGKATYTVYASHTYVKPCGSVIYSGIGPEGPRPPDYPTRNALNPTISYYTGVEQDTWETLSGLGLSTCSCSITRDPDNALFGFTTTSCPEPCISGIGPLEEDPYCGDMSVS